MITFLLLTYRPATVTMVTIETVTMTTAHVRDYHQMLAMIKRIREKDLIQSSSSLYHFVNFLYIQIFDNISHPKYLIQQ